MQFGRTISLLFAAGALGGLFYGLVAWLLGDLGISRGLGVRMNPVLTAPWIYQQVVWGGMWGMLFALPLSMHWLARGLTLSLLPSFVQLFFIYPVILHQGPFGIRLGILTPVLVLLVNGVWGIVAAWWLQTVRGGGYR